MPPVDSKPKINYQDILPPIIPLAILLLVLMFYFRREYRKKKKLYNELNVMKDEAESDEQKE